MITALTTHFLSLSLSLPLSPSLSLAIKRLAFIGHVPHVQRPRRRRFLFPSLSPLAETGKSTKAHTLSATYGQGSRPHRGQGREISAVMREPRSLRKRRMNYSAARVLPPARTLAFLANGNFRGVASCIASNLAGESASFKVNQGLMIRIKVGSNVECRRKVRVLRAINVSFEGETSQP